MGEIKQVNFRLDDARAAEFRKFCEDSGLSQAQGFDHLMQVLEMDNAKAAIPDRKTEIEEFERLIKNVLSAYMHSIELNSNAEARAKEQFKTDLERKDKTIDDLRQKITDLQADKQAADAARDDAQKASVAAAEREVNATNQMQAARKNAADQERINTMLTAQLADATDKLEGYDELKASEASLKAEAVELRHQLKEAAAQAELAQERAVMEKERELTAKISEIEKENARLQARLDALNK